MKRYQSIIVSLGLLFMGIVSCKKETDQILSSDQLGVGSYLKLDSTVNTNLNYSQINTSSVSIMVSGYGEEIDSVVTYVSTNNSLTRSTWRRVTAIKAASNKAVLVATSQQIATALGVVTTALSPGKQYVLYNEIVTKSGKRYSLQNTNGDFESAPDYKMAMRWRASVVCPFDPVAAAGTYTITQDPWDGAVGETAVVTATANTITVTYLYPYASPDPGFRPVTINVNPQTGSATMAKQIYGGYGAGFQNFTGQGTGFVFSCTGTITLSVQHVSAGGTNYGAYPITLVK